MPKALTRYTVLLSAPGDAAHECEIADEELQKINRTHSSETGIDFYPTDWRRDSRADSGDEPQKLLNRQIVEDADIILAIFKERFGTPTSQYGSGTEEEIMLGLEMGKPVLVYFWNPRPDFVPKDANQYAKIGALRSRLQSKVMYQVFSDEAALRNKITHDFTKLLYELEGGTISPKPQLTVQGINAEGQLISEEAELVYPIITKRLNPAAYDSRVRTAFSKALSLKLTQPARTKPVMYSEVKAAALGGITISSALADQMKEATAKWSSSAAPFSKREKVVVPEASKALVLKEAADLGIEVTEDLFDLGGLEESEQYIPSVYGPQEKMLFGTDEEKEKRGLLSELIESCRLRSDFRGFISANSSIGAIALAVSNDGGSPANHVNVELRLPSECVVRSAQIALPSSFLVGHGLDTQETCSQVIEHIFALSESPHFKEYDAALVRTESGLRVPPMITTFSANPLQGERYLDNEDFEELLEYALGDYHYIDDEKTGMTIVRISFDRMQQCQSYAFPCRLLVRGKNLEAISFRIVADETDKPVEGTLVVSSLEEDET
ncbi:MAG: hypothetical protein IKG22_07045 [Atopobiaceae bacterium]|nr:hypothetical protein [Atopobiaceae bacterium]